MMKKFASYTLSGRIPAFVVVFGCLFLALVSPLFQFFAILSGAAIVLITLHAGPRNSLYIIVISTAALTASSYFLIQQPFLGAATATAQLIPSFIIAAIFYSTRSLSLSLQATALLGALGFIALTILFPNSALFWQKALTPMLTPVLEAGGYTLEQIPALIAQSSKYMNGLLVASVVLVHSSILLFGYYLYSLHINSPQFREDFKQLRLGKVLAVLTVITGVWAVASGSEFAAQLCGILAILFFLQGMALIHTTCGTMTKGKLWLIITYIFVIFVPQVIVIVILLGLFDTLFKLRKHAT